MWFGQLAVGLLGGELVGSAFSFFNDDTFATLSQQSLNDIRDIVHDEVTSAWEANTKAQTKAALHSADEYSRAGEGEDAVLASITSIKTLFSTAFNLPLESLQNPEYSVHVTPMYAALAAAKIGLVSNSSIPCPRNLEREEKGRCWDVPKGRSVLIFS